jgi:hypothetical protein
MFVQTLTKKTDQVKQFADELKQALKEDMGV